MSFDFSIYLGSVLTSYMLAYRFPVFLVLHTQKHQRTIVFLMFFGCAEREQWEKINYAKDNLMISGSKAKKFI